MDYPLHHLPECITPHHSMGDIGNVGVYQSLLSKVEIAVSLADQGNTDAAANLLNALINELQAQRGRLITESAADMLIHHAEMTIEQIS